MAAIGVLCPFDPSLDPGPPEATPLGRAALRLGAEGLTVVFGDDAADGALSGLVPAAGRWDRVERIGLAAAYDRYPSQKWPSRHATLLSGLGDVPTANADALVALCRDKLACQAWLEAAVPMPEVESDPARFAERLEAWGAGFLKPRYGAFGVGIRRVTPGDPLPARGEALQGEEPLVLQRAIAAPVGWAGVSVRALVQREGAGWVVAPLVARRHRTDPVVNVSRGASAAPAEAVLAPDTLAALIAQAELATARLAAHPDGDRLVEVGLDLVVDDEGRPWTIEANGRPRGRIFALAEADARWAGAHLEAALRPLRAVAALGRPR